MGASNGIVILADFIDLEGLEAVQFKKLYNGLPKSFTCSIILFFCGLCECFVTEAGIFEVLLNYGNTKINVVMNKKPLFQFVKVDVRILLVEVKNAVEN